MKEMIDLWKKPAVIAPNNFKFKSLSNWSYNIAVGCVHGCGFCYVPEVSTRKMGLEEYGVEDADAQWGEYVLVRPWDEHAFMQSLRRAEAVPVSALKPDGNRAVMLCTTTDPYQTISHDDKAVRDDLNKQLERVVFNALDRILHKSTLNVRILTRSPLARQHFDIMKAFGNRLMFGMSLPTLNNKLARVYEPHAPAPTKRLETLLAAQEAGLNVFVAMAPTYPECDDSDLARTLEAIACVDPMTVFMEPINIRADNVGRFKRLAEEAGVTLRSSVFESREQWRDYSMRQMHAVECHAKDIGIEDRLHIWPDIEMRGYANQGWLDKYWNRISEWPK